MCCGEPLEVRASYNSRTLTANQAHPLHLLFAVIFAVRFPSAIWCSQYGFTEFPQIPFPPCPLTCSSYLPPPVLPSGNCMLHEHLQRMTRQVLLTVFSLYYPPSPVHGATLECSPTSSPTDVPSIHLIQWRRRGPPDPTHSPPYFPVMPLTSPTTTSGNMAVTSAPSLCTPPIELMEQSTPYQWSYPT